MRQTWALLIDGYRELNAKKLFWISLILSGVVIGAFAFLGISGNSLTIGTTVLGLPDAWVLYKGLYSMIIAGWWLTWGAVVLAIISTSTMVPDLIASGTIELYFSRPISRLRLFLTKYVAGLFFVAGQVGVVAVGSLLVIRWRAGHWVPAVLLEIPLVLLVFSYVFAVAVLVGVWTRSTVGSILLCLLAWGIFSSTQFIEQGLRLWQIEVNTRVNHAQRTIEENTASLNQYKAHPMDDLTGVKAAYAKSRLDDATAELPDLQHSKVWADHLHELAVAIWIIVPKTRETANLLDRYLFTDEEMGIPLHRKEDRDIAHHREDRIEGDEARIEVEQEMRERSIPVILGSSLAFEGITLAVAAWIFCKRDY